MPLGFYNQYHRPKKYINHFNLLFRFKDLRWKDLFHSNVSLFSLTVLACGLARGNVQESSTKCRTSCVTRLPSMTLSKAEESVKYAIGSVRSSNV